MVELKRNKQEGEGKQKRGDCKGADDQKTIVNENRIKAKVEGKNIKEINLE